MNAAEACVRHARMRWLGLPLLLGGLALLVLGIISMIGAGSWTSVALGLFGTGLALGAFGANNDTALAYALEARRLTPDALPDGLSAELDDELERDRAAVMGLHASPRVAVAMPLAALLVQCLAVWKLVS